MHAIEPEELMAYLDGELGPERAAEAREHLAECRECQGAAADLQQVGRKMGAWTVEAPGTWVSDVVRAGWKERKEKRRWWVWPAVAAAAVGMVALVVGPRFETPRLERPERMPLMIAPLSQGGQQGAAPRAVAAAAEPAPVDAARTKSPLIVRTAEITLVSREFETTRAAIEAILKRYGGHIGQMRVDAPLDGGRTLTAKLRIPSEKLDAALAEMRGLGHVLSEQQVGEDVTAQVVDLEARLDNARNTERGLVELLRRSTGKVTDLLAVEREMARVRGEIEQMEAERKGLGDRISFSTVDVRVNEEYKARLDGGPMSGWGRLRNAAVDGYRNVVGSVVGAAEFGLSAGPVIVLWGALLAGPVWYFRRWFRRRRQVKETSLLLR